MPNLDGMGLLKALQVHEPGLPVILLTAHGSIDSAVEAVKLGAFDYLEKPFDKDQIHQIVRKAITTRERSGPSIQPSPPPGEIADPCAAAGMVGRSPSMQAIREIVGTVAASPSTVLIAGESGTGKELVARALHLGSSRREPAVRRGQLRRAPGGLVESELFGHERGAFTGAVSSQRRSLRARRRRHALSRRGRRDPRRDRRSSCCARSRSRSSSASAASRPARRRAARSRPPTATSRSSSARASSARTCTTASTSCRSTCRRCASGWRTCRSSCRTSSSAATSASARASRACPRRRWRRSTRYGWPGNIRELENLMERMVLFASGPLIDEDDLPDAYAGEAGASAPSAAESSTRLSEPGDRQIRLPLSSLGQDLKEAVKAGSRLVEEALIREALAKTDGNVTRSARALGISRRSLQSKMKELGLRESPDEERTQGPAAAAGELSRTPRSR